MANPHEKCDVYTSKAKVIHLIVEDMRMDTSTYARVEGGDKRLLALSAWGPTLYVRF